MPDLEISKLPSLSGGALQGGDLVPLTDVSASETKKITVKELIQDGISLIDDGSISGDKVDIVINEGSIGTFELADKSVTAIKMADGSTGVVAPGPLPSGEYEGQLGFDTVANAIYVWDGTQWLEPAGSSSGGGAVNGAIGDPTGLVPTEVTDAGGNAKISASLADTTAGGRFLAGPAGAAGAIEQRAIVGSDLPLATTTEKGAVVVNGNGLAMQGQAIRIDNSITASGGTFNVCDVNANGLVVNYRPISGSDLPPPNGSTPGAVVPGRDLELGAGGALDHVIKLSAPGTYPKVTCDATGHVTAGEALTADDIPEISADKIIGGQLDVSSTIPDRSIEEIKLADYSTAQMQEGNPGQGYKLGHLWYQPSTAQLRIYARGSDGNQWLPIGFGALQANNLRWGGTIDANLSTLGVITSIAASEGLTAGAAIPAPSDALSGMYFVTQVEGANVNHPNVSGQSFTSGDWLLCINAAQGYVRIDVNDGGGGGGGGVNYLDDLLDVEIGPLAQGPFGVPTIDLADGQMLMYDGDSGMWRNYDVIDGGTY